MLRVHLDLSMPSICGYVVHTGMSVYVLICTKDAPFPHQLVVPAALGTPPQPFRLLVDLAWDTLFVPSADMEIGYMNGSYDNFLHFFANQSHTYVPGNKTATIAYWTEAYEGNLSHDVFHIAGLSVPDQPFINAEEYRDLGMVSFWNGYDGVLGLSPGWNATSRWRSPAPSPWATLVEQGILDHNLFTLDLPHGPRSWTEITPTGSMTFGAIDPKYANSQFTSLPLSGYTNQAWTVQAHSVTWHNKTHPIHQTFKNYTLAGFDTSMWYLGLPGSLAHDIRRLTPGVKCDPVTCWVDCDARKNMPDLTVGFFGQEPGTVEELTITAFDYAPELILRGGERSCTFEFTSTDGEWPVDAIMLGTNFLTAFYR